jgi:hypothetical protein
MRKREVVTHRRALRLLGAVLFTALLCGGRRDGIAVAFIEDAPGPQPTPTPTPMPQPIAAVMGGVEAAIDAPWRIEPDPASPRRYPTIPLVVSIHDESLQSDPNPALLGPFCEMAIREEAEVGPTPPPEYHRAGSLEEVERSDRWPNDDDYAGHHRLCRPASGQDCSADLVVHGSAEWHGTVLYAPKTQLSGADVRLTVQVRVARFGQPCGDTTPIIEDAPFDRLGPYPPSQPPAYPAGTAPYVITNRLIVHLGDEPLPRFGTSYVYGDLHYHSQGTDNEGESAYAYRPTLQAMRAMGLDFLFATDHASASADGQTTDIDEIFVRIPDDIPYVPSFLDGYVHDWLQGKADKLPIGAQTRREAARDMSAKRFQALRALLNDPPGVKALGAVEFPTGANAEVMRLPGRRQPARIFLGGEVDVIPEMSPGERASGHIVYGNGRTYGWKSACTLMPEILEKMREKTTASICEVPDELAELAPEGGRYLVGDLQGLGEDHSYKARQHFVHLPVDGTRDDAFVASHTSLFGGATRRLRYVIDEDYTAAAKGYAFLAHPVEAESGNGLGRLGPDIVPYSDVQLRTAFESPYMLGLELWNGDAHLQSWRTTPGEFQGFPLQAFDQGPSFTRWLWRRWSGPQPTRTYTDLHDGLAAWDKMLLWGMRPSQTTSLSWLAAGEPRRVFVAGGSDAHGDLNYRRQGSTGLSAVLDTAIGKPRNLVYVGLERPETVSDPDGNSYGVVGQGQVTTALASGNFAVTDGPALRIAMDVNGNGIIDPADVPMGGVAHGAFRGTYVPFVVEWKSTEEFGPVASLDLYVGVVNDASDAGLVYAGDVYGPEDHGVHSSSTKSGAVSPNPYLDSNGGLHYELQDGYMLDPTGGLQAGELHPGKLHVVVSPDQGRAGKLTVLLRANDFPVGKRRVVEGGDPVCGWNMPACGKPGAANDDGCEYVCTDPPPTEYHFDDVSLPDRMFVRAFARTAPPGGDLCQNTGDVQTVDERLTQRSGQCNERLAFTNPVWVDNMTAPPPPGDYALSCAPASLAIDIGNRATTTCTVTSLNAFAKPVFLSCLDQPAGTSCSFGPATVTPPANGSVTSTLTVSVGVANVGTSTFRVKGLSSSAITHLTGMTLTVGAGRALTASFDPAWQAPSCGSRAGRSCDSGATLVIGRSAGGREPNAPNTIGGSCADGTTGPASGRWNAVDSVKVYTADGSLFAPNKTVRVDAGVWASSTPSVDAVDFFSAADAANPAWTLIGSVVPTVAGAQTLSATYRLPPGGMQALRVQYRQKSSSMPCAAGATNDRDDVVFAVGP